MSNPASRPYLNRHTQVCISLAARPSNLGTRFHNFLYDELGLDFLYKAMTTNDIAAAIGGVRALGFRGCSISMPFKESVITLIDELDESAEAIGSVNTIVNTDGVLVGHNTDYGAVRKLVSEAGFPKDARVLVRGSGGMAKATAAAFRDLGYHNGVLWARNASTASPLASELGYEWVASGENLEADVLVNVTPIGMSGGDETALAFSEMQVRAASLVFDLVAVPEQTQLIQLAEKLEKPTIMGTQVSALQAAEQFFIYTGVKPSPDQVRAASEFSRAT